MMVVALIAVLGAIAMSIYVPYTRRARCTDAEVAAYDTMVALQQTLAETGVAPAPDLNYLNSRNIGGQQLNYPQNVTVSYSGAGVTGNLFVVNANRTNPICPRGDGTYTLTQGQTEGVW